MINKQRFLNAINLLQDELRAENLPADVTIVLKRQTFETLVSDLGFANIAGTAITMTLFGGDVHIEHTNP